MKGHLNLQRHKFWTPIRSVFEKVVRSKFQVFGLILPWIEITTYCIQREHETIISVLNYDVVIGFAPSRGDPHLVRSGLTHSIWGS